MTPKQIAEKLKRVNDHSTVLRHKEPGISIIMINYPYEYALILVLRKPKTVRPYLKAFAVPNWAEKKTLSSSKDHINVRYAWEKQATQQRLL